MNIFKFRAWGKKSQKMIQNIDTQTLFEHNDLFHIMQYIGKSDKNDNEIYQGDVLSLVITPELMQTSFANSNLGKAVAKQNVSEVILVFDDDNPVLGLPYWIYFKINGEPERYDDDAHTLVTHGRGTDNMFPQYFIQKGGIVIGNKYENPELVK